METIEDPVFSFQIITDTHVTADREHEYNSHFEQALQDIAELSPQSKGIMHIGDVTDHGFEQEYDEFDRIWSSYESKLPRFYITSGNHDVGLGNWQERSNRFLTRTGNEKLYHDHWIHGYHFIFLSTEAGLERYCTLSQPQLHWLQQRLEGHASANKPIFLFVHQPLKNTVAGSMEHQDWYGVTEDEQLQAIIQQYPQIVMFTGHTHWELGAPYTYNEAKPAMFNAASVAYLWTDEDEYKYGSQGYYVDVYDDRLVVRGRDFVHRSWIKQACYTLPLL